MLTALQSRLQHLVHRVHAAARARVASWLRPVPLALVAGVTSDAMRSRSELVLENALLRQQLVVLSRAAKRPHLTAADRGLLVLLASLLHTWAATLVIVRPETVLRWHRQGFRLLWPRKSAPRTTTARIPVETVDLIRRLAAENRLWGADRIQGELLKLDVRVSKRTIQKYMRAVRAPRPSGQTWATFLRTHADTIWACDFPPVTDLAFRPLFACFVIELATRRVVHAGVTRHPIDAWVAQQLRGATPCGQHPRFLIRDNEGKVGATFARVAATSGIEARRTPYRAPRANGVCERFLGSVGRECLDHLLVFGERHLMRVLREYATSFNQERPHQGLGQSLPEPPDHTPTHREGLICAVPILGGLHHTYGRAA